MVGFFCKKAFFDGWDNLFALALFNIAAIVLVSAFILLPAALGAGSLAAALFTLAGIFAFSQWQALSAFAMNDVADYKTIGFKTSFAHFAKAWKPGLLMGLANSALWFSFTVGIPFYLMQKGFIGLFLASLLFWICLSVLLGSPYFLAAEARRGGGFKKNAKVALFLVLDNIGFSLFLFAYNIFAFLVSAFAAFMAPGPAGLGLSSAVALKLLLKKYEWLEAEPGADRKKVPWTAILAEEKELVGVRTLKGMIFPWKEGK